jgi:hypothetical protein
MRPRDTLFVFEDRLRRLPDDEGGSVLLLTGLMSFVVAIMALMSLDTSQAIYNRIISQNAADAAAETGALWQARGLNMMQSLNNDHYIFNCLIFGYEWERLGQCANAGPDIISEWRECTEGLAPPPFGDLGASCPSDEQAVSNDCQACVDAVNANIRQGQVANDCLQAQQVIADSIPLVANAYASAAAQAAGADDLTDALIGYPAIVAGPLLLSLATAPYALYARTIPPSTTDLNQHSPVNGNHWPWTWGFVGLDPSIWKTAAMLDYSISMSACAIDPLQFGQWASQINTSYYWNTGSWGWSDKYYHGVPGYMVWMAGKTGHDELAGLGLLRWMNGGSQAPSLNYDFLQQGDSPVMYTDSALTSSTLSIPTFVALAGSQTEGSGTEVVAKDAGSVVDQLEIWDQPPVDSAPKLSTVTFPGSATTSPQSATSMWIYH